MSGAGAPIVVGIVANIVVAVTLVLLFNALTTSIVQGVYEGRNTTTSALYLGYNLVAYAALGAILGAVA